jgi:5,10-methenyltetrahydromethanopterin hydrogenase
MKKEIIITHENIVRSKDLEGYKLDTDLALVKVCVYPKYEIMSVEPLPSDKIQYCLEDNKRDILEDIEKHIKSYSKEKPKPLFGDLEELKTSD